MSFEDLSRQREQQATQSKQLQKLQRAAALEHNKVIERVLKEFATAIWGKNGGFLSTPKWRYRPLDIDDGLSWSVLNSAHEAYLNNLGQQYGMERGLLLMKEIALRTDQAIFVGMLFTKHNQPRLVIYTGSLQSDWDLILVSCGDASEDALRSGLRTFYQGFDDHIAVLSQLSVGQVSVQDNVVIKRRGPYLDVQTLLFGQA